MGNLLGRHEETDMADNSKASEGNACPQTPQTTERPRTSDNAVPSSNQAPRQELSASSESSSSSSASTSEDEISDMDEQNKQRMVEAWVCESRRFRAAFEAQKERSRREKEGRLAGKTREGAERLKQSAAKPAWRGVQERGGSESQQHLRGVGDVKKNPDDRRGAIPVRPMKEDRVYVFNVKKNEVNSKDTLEGLARKDTASRLHLTGAEIEEITEQEYRRRVGAESKYSAGTKLTASWTERQTVPSPKSSVRAGTASRIPIKVDGGATLSQSAKTERASSKTEHLRARGARKNSALQKKPVSDSQRRGEQPRKTSTSCVDTTKCLEGESVGGVERLQLTQVGDCVPDWREEARQARTMRSYEYRRDCERHLAMEGGECHEREGCKHCSSKISVLRC